MKWKEYSVLTGADCADSIAEVFHRMGSGGVILEEPQAARGYSTMDQLEGEALNLDYLDHEFVVIKAYFPEQQEVMAELARSLEAVESHYHVKCKVLLNEVKDEDWESTWKEFYHTFKVGERLVIKPSWEEYEPQDEEVVIDIDPGMAFGTGAHASTRFCLQLVDRYIKAGERIIDAGCGSGILSIAAVKLGADHVLAMDIDDLAVQITRDNVRLNQVEDQIQVETQNILETVVDQPVNYILANLTADVILDLLPKALEILPSGGTLLGSGIIDSRWPQVKKQLKADGFEITDILQENDWIGFAARKR